ncbi:MAG: hypothetical protein PVJ67_00450 [Candidatus Pacearchaeota archaeon]|jgi:hypothetical protein
MLAAGKVNNELYRFISDPSFDLRFDEKTENRGFYTIPLMIYLKGRRALETALSYDKCKQKIINLPEELNFDDGHRRELSGYITCLVNQENQKQ